MENVIEAVNLTKYFGVVLSVNHINFEVTKGEIFGFLDPNGAGKTTTIRMLSGLTDPSEGTARIMGHDILRELLRRKRCWINLASVTSRKRRQKDSQKG